MSYRDPLSNLFCVTFDNGSVMGKFYTNIQNMDKSDIAALMQKYVQDQGRNSFYTNQNTLSLPTVLYYTIGDYVKAKSADNTFLIDGRFFINDAGPFGECAKIRPVKFLSPIEGIGCGWKMVYLI
jgi:hypothetical protein